MFHFHTRSVSRRISPIQWPLNELAVATIEKEASFSTEKDISQFPLSCRKLPLGDALQIKLVVCC